MSAFFLLSHLRDALRSAAEAKPVNSAILARSELLVLGVAIPPLGKEPDPWLTCMRDIKLKWHFPPHELFLIMSAMTF